MTCPLPFIGPGLAIRVICQSSAHIREDFSSTNALLSCIVTFYHTSQQSSPIAASMEQLISKEERDFLLQLTECGCLSSMTGGRVGMSLTLMRRATDWPSATWTGTESVQMTSLVSHQFSNVTTITKFCLLPSAPEFIQAQRRECSEGHHLPK